MRLKPRATWPDKLSEAGEGLVEANQQFARTTKPKLYEQHVAEGRRQGIYFETAMPYGEDRDADGEIDPDHRRRFERARRRAEQTGNSDRDESTEIGRSKLQQVIEE